MAGYHNPGYAVAQTVDEILQRRKAESRQAMLDELNARVSKANMENQAAQAESLKAERESNAKLRKAQEGKLFMDRLRDYGPQYEPTEEEVKTGTDFGFGGAFIPPTQEEVINYDDTGVPTGEVTEGNTPTFKTSKSGSYKLRPTYAQQQDQLEQTMLANAMKDPNIPTSVKQYYQFPKGDRPTASLFEQPMDLGEYDPAAEEGKRISNLNHPGQPVTVTSKNRPVVRSRAPQPPASATPTPQVILYVDPRNGTATSTPVTDKATGKQLVTPDAGVNIAPQPAAPKFVPPAVDRALKDAQTKARPKGLFSGFQSNPGAQLDLATATAQYINAFPLQGTPEDTQTVRELAQQRFAAKDSPESQAATLDQLATTNPPLPPELQGQLRNLLAVIMEKQ